MKSKLNVNVSGKVSNQKINKYSGKTALIGLTPSQVKTLQRLANYNKNKRA
jgi:hypothetical protein